MNVIALFSFPQECGDNSLRFINCFDGQVVLDINLTPQKEVFERVVHREILSEKGTFYDRCTKQRFKIGDVERGFPYMNRASVDKECTKSLDLNLDSFWEKYEDEDLTVIGAQRIKVLPFESEDEKEYLGGRKVYSWKYTVAKTHTDVEYVYHPEWDTVYQEILQKCGIKCSYDERQDYLAFAGRVAEAKGYKLLNTLWG